MPSARTLKWGAFAAGLTALSQLAWTQVARAEDSRWSMGATAGTLGAGPEVSFRPIPQFGVRANAGWLTVSRDEDVDDIRYDGDLKLRSYGAMLDWYPTGGAFRISAGARANDNEIELEGRPTTNVVIGDTSYTPAQVGTLTGTVTTDDFAPMLTIGYGGTIGTGFTVTADVGVMWQGSPQIDNLRATGLLASFPQFQSDLEREERNIEDEVDDYKLWPVLQVSVLYRF